MVKKESKKGKESRFSLIRDGGDHRTKGMTDLEVMVLLFLWMEIDVTNPW